MGQSRLDVQAVLTTLRRYLEEVIAKISPKESARIISDEAERLAEATVESKLKANRYVSIMITRGIPFEAIREGLDKANTLSELSYIVRNHPSIPDSDKDNVRLLVPPSRESSVAFRDINEARTILDRTPFSSNKDESSDSREPD